MDSAQALHVVAVTEATASNKEVDPLPPEHPESFTELFTDLATEVGTLVRQEVSHAVAEIGEKARYAGRNAMLMGVGALIGAVSLLVLVFALVLTLGNVLPVWLSAFLIAALLGGFGFFLFHRGSSALHAMAFVPTETFASIEDDRAWAKQEIAETREQMSSTIGEFRRRLTLAAAKKKAPRRAPAAKAAPKRKRAGSPVA